LHHDENNENFLLLRRQMREADEEALSLHMFKGRFIVPIAKAEVQPPRPLQFFLKRGAA
jgi:hypothetical protein